MKKIIFTFLIIFMGSISYAQNFETYKLDNGQTIVIKEVRENPIVIIDTWVKTGSINETDQNNGVAHFLEHMFFKGTTKFPTGEYDRILESKGAMTNAATSKDFTHYYIEIPSKDFSTALEMHADMLTNPLIPRNEMEKERKVVLEEIAKNEDSPQRIMYHNLIAQLYKTHPYKREVIGTRKVIETITREEMLDFFNTYYKPANMTTVIVGDVDAQDALEQVKKAFTAPASKSVMPKFNKEKPLSSASEVQTKADVETAYMLIGFRGVDAKNRKENNELDVLATILGDGVTSRLYKSVKEQKRLVQYIGASNSSGRDDSLFTISANFAPENLEKVKRAIIEEITAIQQQPPSEEELKRAFSIIERDTYYSRESVENISNEIGYISTIFSDLNMYNTYINDIKKVTPHDVQLAAKKFLDTKKMAVSIVLPKNYTASNVNREAECKNNIAAPILVSQNDSIKKYKLTNNATMLVNQNNSNDIIAIRIYAAGGKLLEQKPGVSSVVASGMFKGTEKYTKNEFNQLLEEKGIKLSAQNGLESFSISLKTTKNELDTALDLLREALNNALFDEYEVEKIKTDILYAIKVKRDRPIGVAFEEFYELIFQNSPYAKSTSKNVERFLPSVNVNDVKAYYKSIFNPNNIIVSINGNISDAQKDELAQYFSKVFQSQSKGKFDFASYKNLIPSLGTTKQKIVKKETQAAWLVLGWQTCGYDNLHDYITLQVIDSLMGGGMSSRLFNHLRDKQGLAYQVGSSYSANMNKGYFVTYIGTNTKTAEHSKSEMLREINVLKHEFVTQNELQAAKDKLIGSFILSQETNNEKASTIGWFEFTNRGYDFNKKYIEMIKGVTPSDIISVANKYFSQPYVYTMVAP